MGLKCSLLGHRFGDPDVEREREERGSEVVTTTREVAVCERCEEKRVLSENKEVTAVIDESELDGQTDAGADADPGPEPAAAPEPEPDGDDLVSEAVKNVQAEREATGGMADIDVPEEDEGAEIMSDEGDEPRERGFGEWPTEPGDEPEPWDPEAADPDRDAPDGDHTADAERNDGPAGTAASHDDRADDDERPFGTGRAEDATPDTGAEIIDDGPDDGPDDNPTNADSTPTGDASTGGGPAGGAHSPDAASTPSRDAEPTGQAGDGSEIIDAEDQGGVDGGHDDRGDADLIDADATAETGGNESSRGDEPSVSDASSRSDASFEETEAASPSRPDAYECPECGFETTATNSPLRAGDPCPECSAYLVGSERKN